MSRHSTIPILYDECKTISLSFLKKWGYLKQGEWKSGNIAWSRSGNKTGSISFSVDLFTERPHFELSYKYNDQPIKYRVQLVTIPSNLGRGNVWYFRCPHTSKRCRKLYLIEGKFFHRSAFRGCFYEKQTYSQRNRDLCRSFETIFEAENAYDQMHTKYFKKQYAGKPTKRYLRLQKMIQLGEGVCLKF